jgi:chaperonin GroEL
MALTRGIQKAVEKIVDELQRLAEKIDDKDEKEITEVATIASNNNTEIGKKLAEAMKLVGASNGVITIEEGKTADTEVVVVQGMQFDRGYLSPHFVTNQDAVIAELENTYILIYEEKITSAKNLIPLLETISKKKEPLLIITGPYSGEAFASTLQIFSEITEAEVGK